MLKKIIAGYAGWKILIFTFLVLATFVLPVNEKYSGGTLAHNYPYWLKVWANFDGYHYMRVASRGYHTFNLPFFPLFPLTIRALIQFVPYNTFYLLSGLFISYTSFIGALYFMVKLLKLDRQIDKLTLFLMVLFLYPTSFYFGAVYNDSLFLLFAVLCIYLSRQQKWGWAGVAGALATLTRLNGLALAVFMFFEYLGTDDAILKTWELKRFLKNMQTQLVLSRIWRSRIWLAGLIPLAYLGFLTYIQITFGDWRLIHKAMAVWGQDKVTLPMQVFWRYAKILSMNVPTDLTYWVAMIELSFVLFYIFILWMSWKKIRFSYWIFVAVSILIPSLTGTFAGMPRYALHLYPFFLALTIFLDEEPRYSRWLYFAISIAVFFICLTFYTRGYFIA